MRCSTGRCRPRFAAGVVALALAGPAVSASGDELLTPTKVIGVLEQKALEIAKKDKALARRLGERGNTRGAKQVQAASAASATTDPADNPSLPELISLAIDEGVVSAGENHSIRLGLNLFSLAAAARPNMDTTKYDQLSWMRRLGGAVTFGGLGERLDQDGDGKPDDPLEAKSLTDSVGWEVIYRFWGSRDPREFKVAERIARPLEGRISSVVSSWSAFYRTEIALRKAGGETLCELEDRDHNVHSECLSLVLEQPRVQRMLLDLLIQEIELDEATRAAVKNEERSLVVSAVATGVERKPELGPDKLGFGLRAAWGRGAFDHTLNLDWSQREAFGGLPEPRVFKAAYKATGEVFEGFLPSAAKLSLSAAFERYDNVPSAKHRTVAQVGGRLEFPLTKAVAIPVSVKWVNHQDLLTDEDDVIGNVGISIDLSELRAKAE